MELTQDTVVVVPLDEVPPAVLAERERLGLDKRDEVWEGVLHMVPAASPGRSDVQLALYRTIYPLAAERGLWVSTAAGLIPPDEPGWQDYRVPDLVVTGRHTVTHRAIEGPAELVVEVRSPGDHSFRKLPFYARQGVREVLMVVAKTRDVRRWVLVGTELVEQEACGCGRHHLSSLPVDCWTERGQLLIETEHGLERA